MTRRDYELIADTIKRLPENPTKLHIACAFLDALGKVNSGLVPKRFMSACGITYPVDDRESLDAQDQLKEMERMEENDDE